MNSRTPTRPGPGDKYWAFCCTALRSASRFAVAIAVARLAGVADYALFVQLIAAEVIVLALVQSLAVAPLISLAPGRPDDEVARLIDLARQRTLGLSWGAALLAATVLALTSGPGMLPVTLAYSVSIGAWSLATLGRGWYAASFCSNRAFLIDLAAIGIMTAAPLLSRGLGGDVLSWFWWASAIAGCTVSLGLPLPGGRGSKSTAAVDRAFRTMARQMSVGTVANALGSRIQPFVLGIGGAAVVASYGAAATLIGPVRMFAMALGGVLRPRVSLAHNRGDRAGLRRLVLGSAAALGLLGGGLLGVSVLAGNWIGSAVFGQEIGAIGAVLIAASVYGGAEGIGACLVVAMQIGRADGPALATRLRIGASATGLVLLAPAVVYFGAAGAFSLAALLELAFVVAAAYACRKILSPRTSGQARVMRSRSCSSLSAREATSAQAAPVRIASSHSAARSVTSG